jgi:hypothetical protein
MDLSPGGSTPPVTALAGCIVSFFTRKFYHAACFAFALALNHQQASPSPQRRTCRQKLGHLLPSATRVIPTLAPFPPPATLVIPKLGSLPSMGNTGHPDRSRPAHLLFCFAPAKQPACEVEGSLFAFLRRQHNLKTTPTQNKNGPETFSEPFLPPDMSS